MENISLWNAFLEIGGLASALPVSVFCVCARVCVCVCVRTHMFVCVCVYVCACLCVRMSVCRCVSEREREQGCKSVYAINHYFKMVLHS